MKTPDIKIFNLASKFSVCLALIFFTTVNVSAQCAANFTTTPGANNQLIFTSISTSINPTTSYTWSFSNGTPSNVIGTGSVFSQVSSTFPAPGFYTVTLLVSTAIPACTSSIISTIVVQPTCALTSTTSLASSSTACNGSASVSAPNFCSGASYFWVPGNLAGPTQNSLCPGTYTVFATSTGSTLCCPSATAIVTVGANTCNLSANFSYSIGSSGLVNFFNTSTGTISGTSFTWYFGDNSVPANTSNASHTYSAVGSYSVVLSASNGLGCTDSSLVQIITPNLCNVVASFADSLISNGTYSFYSTSGNVGTGPTFLWNFGDGGVGTGSTAVHSYSASGIFPVTLTVISTYTPYCASTFSTLLSVTVFSCNINASYTHTVQTNGLVNFRSTSTGTTNGTKYFWDFGDGFTAVVKSPNHTYANAGSHYVKLFVSDTASTFCQDSLTQSINITGIGCSANSNFLIEPTNVQGFWTATPFYPYNVTAAVWSWGDGTKSNGIYSSHTYTAAGTYSICLTVTVSCGGSSSFCTTYLLNKPQAGTNAYQINILPPPLQVALEELEISFPSFLIYPNPSNRYLTIQSENETISANGVLYDFSGKKIIAFEIGDKQEIDLLDLPDGIYFLKITTTTAIQTSKIVLSR